MRSLKKRGPHVLDDLNDLLFSLHYYISLFAIKAATESRRTEQGTTAQTCKHKKKKELQI